MTPDTNIITKLEDENKELREKLTIAEQWIGRELSEIHFRKMKAEATKTTKNGLEETVKEIEKRIRKYFGDSYELMGRENMELLIESERNFSYLVRQKELDGLIITNTYQKILENIFEETITRHFRENCKTKRIKLQKNDILEKTLYKVVQSNFHLSIGKIYLVLKSCFEEKSDGLIEMFRNVIEKEPIFNGMIQGNFWEYFSDIIETQAFGEKRHAGKITLKDARFLREKITGNFEKEGFLKIILDYIK